MTLDPAEHARGAHDLAGVYRKFGEKVAAVFRHWKTVCTGKRKGLCLDWCGSRWVAVIEAHGGGVPLTDALAHSTIPELQTLRRTLVKWRNENLAYFYSGRLTNARTEGFNAKAKLVKRRAYGYRSFKHDRLRLLNACR